MWLLFYTAPFFSCFESFTTLPSFLFCQFLLFLLVFSTSQLTLVSTWHKTDPKNYLSEGKRTDLVVSLNRSCTLTPFLWGYHLRSFHLIDVSVPLAECWTNFTNIFCTATDFLNNLDGFLFLQNWNLSSQNTLKIWVLTLRQTRFSESDGFSLSQSPK